METALNCLTFLVGSGVIVYLFRLIFLSGKYCKAIEALEKDVPFVKDGVESLINSFAKLIGVLKGKGIIDSTILFKTASPLQLTDAGKQLLQDSKFEEFFNANKIFFFSYIDKQKPKTPFDVEAIAKEAMFYLDLNKVPKAGGAKDYAYQKGVPIADILRVYSIEVRDRYFHEHPEILEPSKKG